MPLIIPEGKLSYEPPWEDGVPTAIGFSRDWRFTEEWSGVGIQYLDDLKAIAPSGSINPRSMAGWTLQAGWDPAVRYVKGLGQPVVYWMEFYDSAPTTESYSTIYAAAQSAYNSAYSIAYDQAVAAGYDKSVPYGGMSEADIYAKGVAQNVYNNYVNTRISFLNQAKTAYVKSDIEMNPNIVIRMNRYSAPEDQLMIPGTAVSVEASLCVSLNNGIYELDEMFGTWMDGYVTLIIPYADERRPDSALVWQVLINDNTAVTTPVEFATVKCANSESEEAEDNIVKLEYIEDQDKFPGGGYIIISNKDNVKTIRNRSVKLETGYVYCFMCGMRQQVNIAPILYSGSGSNQRLAWAPKALPIYGGVLTDVTWNYVVTNPGGWTMGVTTKDVRENQWFGTYRPLAIFDIDTAGVGERPVMWFITEDHAQTLSARYDTTPDVTEGETLLKDLSYSVDKTWRGARATATFHSSNVAEFASWMELGRVDLYMGWQTTTGIPASSDSTDSAKLASQHIAVMYIMPGGIQRSRNGDNAAQSELTIELGDFVSARMEHGVAVDFRQAGGRTIYAWFSDVGKRLGLQDDMIYVEAGIADTEIPLNAEDPSKPSFEVPDGTSWSQHLDQICDAMGLRWSWSPIGNLCIDSGPPVYVDGTSAIEFEIDLSTVIQQKGVTAIRHSKANDKYRNSAKVNYGTENNRKSLWLYPEAPIINADGGLYWEFIDDINVQNATQIIGKRWKEVWVEQDIIEFDVPLRVGLYPDMFVKVGTAPELGLEVGSVYQIESIDHSMSNIKTNIKARLVYSPAAQAAATKPVLNAALGSGGL